MFESVQERAAMVGVLGVATTLAFNWLVISYGRVQTRLSVTTAIRSDVRSIVQALHLTSVVKAFVGASQLEDADLLKSAWNDARREENYFKLYESLAPQLGVLQHELSKDVVKFYTFLHVSRDAAVPLGEIAKGGFSVPLFHAQIAKALVALREVLSAAEVVLDSRFSASGTNDEGVTLAKAMRSEVENALASLSARYKQPVPTLA